MNAPISSTFPKLLLKLVSTKGFPLPVEKEARPIEKTLVKQELIRIKEIVF